MIYQVLYSMSQGGVMTRVMPWTLMVGTMQIHIEVWWHGLGYRLRSQLSQQTTLHELLESLTQRHT